MNMKVAHRRKALAALGALALPWRLLAGEPLPVVGVVVTHAPPSDTVFTLLRAAMKDHGWEDGRNVKLEVVSAFGHMERVQAIADDFVRRNVAVLVTPNEPATRAAMAATRTIPIIMLGFGADPVALGLVDSVRRPKGNVTGIHSLPDTLDGKRLQLLKEIVPSARKVAALWHPPFGEKPLKALELAGKTLGIRIQGFEVSAPEHLEEAFRLARSGGCAGVLTTWSPVIYIQREIVAKLGLQYRLPVITPYANDGVDTLMAYGTDLFAAWRRGGYYVHRLLSGAKPSDLPIEEISTFRMKINMKTARKLGIKFPQSILVRAEDVVE